MGSGFTPPRLFTSYNSISYIGILGMSVLARGSGYALLAMDSSRASERARRSRFTGGIIYYACSKLDGRCALARRITLLENFISFVIGRRLRIHERCEISLQGPVTRADNFGAACRSCGGFSSSLSLFLSASLSIIPPLIDPHSRTFESGYQFNSLAIRRPKYPAAY